MCANNPIKSSKLHKKKARYRVTVTVIDEQHEGTNGNKGAQHSHISADVRVSVINGRTTNG